MCASFLANLYLSIYLSLYKELSSQKKFTKTALLFAFAALITCAGASGPHQPGGGQEDRGPHHPGGDQNSRKQKECLARSLAALGLHNRSEAACHLGGFQCGSIAQHRAQVERYLHHGAQAARGNYGLRQGTTTVCETGVFKGESATIWLCSHPRIHLYAFDYKLDPTVREVLPRLFPGRVQLFEGSSVKTLPAFQRSQPEVRCAIASIDGGHFGFVPLHDLYNFAAMTIPNRSLVLIDEIDFIFEPNGARNDVDELGVPVLSNGERACCPSSTVAWRYAQARHAWADRTYLSHKQRSIARRHAPPHFRRRGSCRSSSASAPDGCSNAAGAKATFFTTLAALRAFTGGEASASDARPLLLLTAVARAAGWHGHKWVGVGTVRARVGAGGAGAGTGTGRAHRSGCGWGRSWVRTFGLGIRHTGLLHMPGCGCWCMRVRVRVRWVLWGASAGGASKEQVDLYLSSSGAWRCGGRRGRARESMRTDAWQQTRPV